MRKLKFLLLSFVLLFAMTVKAIPIVNDVGKNLKTELIKSNSVENQAVVAVTFSFSQRTDYQATPEVPFNTIPMELICPNIEPIDNNYIKEQFDLPADKITVYIDTSIFIQSKNHKNPINFS